MKEKLVGLFLFLLTLYSTNAYAYANENTPIYKVSFLNLIKKYPKLNNIRNRVYVEAHAPSGGTCENFLLYKAPVSTIFIVEFKEWVVSDIGLGKWHYACSGIAITSEE